MIYKIEFDSSSDYVNWEWYWRKSFKLFSRWHRAKSNHSYKKGSVPKKYFDLYKFKIWSNVPVTEETLVYIFNLIKSQPSGAVVVHVASDNTNFIEVL